ncbi:peroxisomal carnitine O-octanoyltransferase-like [Watersipora subatra]|uniref:peroxisomal carnitine O-octanoyltransferase-like n=1 Tax=Watersipora subatra TaxID=2589382 RepID=UPI00355B6E8D
MVQGGRRTFEHDEKLPSLPVPDLNSTLDKYLESVIPHLSAHERQRTELVVDEFRRNEGPKLHQMLVERGKTHRNWLASWWLSYAYLKLRNPISPYVNVVGVAPYTNHYWPPQAGTQLLRNSISLYMLLEHWQLIKREKLVSDSGKAGKEPWSMHQFRYLYNCCRVPGLEEDEICSYFKTDTEGSTPTHIIVLCNKRIYKLDVVDSKGELYTPPLFHETLRLIKTDAERKGPGVGICSLTGGDRITWYQIRKHLLDLSQKNAEHLEAIQSSIITNCLIDETPMNHGQMSEGAILGKPGNVWYDKSYNSIWFENGTTASNCDHAPMDAMTELNLSFYTDCRVIECQGLWNGPEEDLSKAPEFTELEFVVDERVKDCIQTTERKFLQSVRNVEIINPSFGGFGKDLLKKHRLHPDTFVQVCLQYGYYKLHGKPAPTYETATTRRFYQGRTETVRSCTNEALMFSKAMLDPLASATHKIQLFKQAMNKHHLMMKECMDGQGVDRHLLGLKILALENGMKSPEIFEDPAYVKSGGNGNFKLSTSFIGFTSVHGGVVPMCPQGYGFFYRMGLERMVFFISSWKSDADTSSLKLYESVKDSMVEVIELFTTHNVSAI